MVGEQDDHVGRRQLLAGRFDPHEAESTLRPSTTWGSAARTLAPMSRRSWETRTAGDSRASPVFFLYASPSSRIFEPLTERRLVFSASITRRATYSGMWLLMSLASSTKRKLWPSSRWTRQDR